MFVLARRTSCPLSVWTTTCLPVTRATTPVPSRMVGAWPIYGVDGLRMRTMSPTQKARRCGWMMYLCPVAPDVHKMHPMRSAARSAGVCSGSACWALALECLCTPMTSTVELATLAAAWESCSVLESVAFLGLVSLSLSPLSYPASAWATVKATGGGVLGSRRSLIRCTISRCHTDNTLNSFTSSLISCSRVGLDIEKGAT